MKRTILLIALLFSINVFSQSSYVRTFGNANSDFGTSLSECSDKGVVLTVCTGNNGFNVQTGIVKTDVNGNMLWSKVKQIGNYSFPQSVVETSDSGILVMGNANYNPTLNGNDDFLFLLKTDSEGNDLWAKEYYLSANDRPVKLIRSASGGFIICSIGDYNLGSYTQANVVRLEEDGSIRWSKKIFVPFGITPSSMVETASGNICIAGNTVGYSPIFFNDVIVCLLDASGNQIWSKVFQTYYDDECNVVTTNSSGELFLSGRAYYIDREWDSFNLKLDSAGSIMYQKLYDAGTSDGEIMRSGIAFDDGSSLLIGDIGGWDDRNITILRINQDGSIRWNRTYPFSPAFTNYPYEIIHSSNDDFIFTGDVRPPSYYRDALLVRTNISGNITCYLDSVTFTEYPDTFTVIQPNVLIVNNVTQPVVSTVNEPANILTEKTICQQIFPVADFTYEEDTICSSQCIAFTDQSLNQPSSWSWTFSNSDSASSSVRDPDGICFTSKGKFLVTLTVTNADGTASITKEITVGSECPVVPYVIPNVFTPNGDGKNDVFEIENLPVTATINIFNRWGTEIFSSEKSNRFWTGYDEKGIKASDGVYYFIVVDNGNIYRGTVQMITSD